MQARMQNPVMVLPEALKSLLVINDIASPDNLPAATRKLVHLRASQINNCSVCVDMHAKELKKLGESDERVISVAAWHDTPYYNDAERAALALTEAATRLSDRSDAVPDRIFEEARRHYDEKSLAALIIQIALINFFNRLNVTVGQQAGDWK